MGDSALVIRQYFVGIESFKEVENPLKMTSTGRIQNSVTAENIERVRHFVRDERKVSITTISTNLNLSRTAIFTILHDHLYYRKLCARWVPRI